MTETRPALSAAEFERRATFRPDNWWVAADELIYVPEVRGIEGWQFYGSPGYMQLTPAQRDLMMWADIIGQVSNGGISQFFDNYRQALEMAEETVQRLNWPELQRHYKAAAADWISIKGKPVTPKKWREEKAKQWERWREDARQFQRRKGNKPATGEDLDRSVMRMQALGLIKMPPAREHPAVDAFDDWFFSDATKLASVRYIPEFVRRHQSDLVRIT